MTIPEAAAELGVSASTLRHQIKNRKLRAHKMGRSWYIAPAEAARYGRDHKRKGNGNDSTPGDI